MIGSAPALDGSYWWAVTYSVPPYHVPDYLYGRQPGAQEWLPSPPYVTVIVDPASGTVVGAAGW